MPEPSTSERPLRSNDPCWCGSARKWKRCHGNRRELERPRVETAAVSPERAVPPTIARPDYVLAGGTVSTPRGRQIQDDASLASMREAGAVAAEVLLRAGAAVAPGVTTDELDAIAHDAYISYGAYPSTLGYQGRTGTHRRYPKSICTSVNGVICHGIPNVRPLQVGDIVNIDVTAYLDGVHGDTSATFLVGEVDAATTALVETTREATLRAIAAVAPGRPTSVIADAVEPFARSRGFGVVREYGGHGIGRTFHAAPHIDHARSAAARQDETFVPGMTFTVEPMLTCGRPEFEQDDDGWAERLVDHLPSAQFEHTVHVTDAGVEILTVSGEGATAVGAL